jgi:hypothetical protein
MVFRYHGVTLVVLPVVIGLMTWVAIEAAVFIVGKVLLPTIPLLTGAVAVFGSATMGLFALLPVAEWWACVRIFRWYLRLRHDTITVDDLGITLRKPDGVNHALRWEQVTEVRDRLFFAEIRGDETTLVIGGPFHGLRRAEALRRMLRERVPKGTPFTSRLTL